MPMQQTQEMPSSENMRPSNQLVSNRRHEDGRVSSCCVLCQPCPSTTSTLGLRNSSLPTSRFPRSSLMPWRVPAAGLTRTRARGDSFQKTKTQSEKVPAEKAATADASGGEGLTDDGGIFGRLQAAAMIQIKSFARESIVWMHSKKCICRERGQ